MARPGTHPAAARGGAVGGAVARMGLALLCLAAAAAAAEERSPQGRGALLYTTFCVECHTTQVHWRDKRIATDLRGLRAQVRRWQDNIGQNWEQKDIDAVTNHLNRTFYKFPGGTDRG